MTTCTWNFRRHAGRVLAATSIVALTSGLVSPVASADQVSDLRAQASALAAQIQTLGQQEEALSERYDAAVMQVQSLQAKVADAQQQLAAAQATAGKAREALLQDAVSAYVNGGNSPLTSGSNGVQSATNSLLRAEYVNTLSAHQNETIDQFHLAALQEQAAETVLKQQTSAAQSQAQQVASLQAAGLRLQTRLQSAYKSDTGQIAVLVAQQQAAAAAAAARAAAQRLAAERAAAAAAQFQTVSAPSNSTVFSPPPPVGHGASGAVAAAESRVGDWYQWGAAGPNTFDCSGLTMWAYEQVGISLPHFSGAQYSDTTHIPISDVQPGDLVFPSDPSQHVAMYVGNGEIVEAPHTGAQVHIVPMGSWFTLAGRVG